MKRVCGIEICFSLLYLFCIVFIAYICIIMPHMSRIILITFLLMDTKATHLLLCMSITESLYITKSHCITESLCIIQSYCINQLNCYQLWITIYHRITQYHWGKLSLNHSVSLNHTVYLNYTASLNHSYWIILLHWITLFCPKTAFYESIWIIWSGKDRHSMILKVKSLVLCVHCNETFGQCCNAIFNSS